MLSAFLVSCIFLACYLVYHANVGSKKFPSADYASVWYTIYLLILVPHIILAAAVPVLGLTTIWLGLRIDLKQAAAADASAENAGTAAVTSPQAQKNRPYHISRLVVCFDYGRSGVSFSVLVLSTADRPRAPNHLMYRLPSIARLILPLIVAMVLLGVTAEVSACPNCKNSVAHNSTAMAAGFAWSIALMLAVPLTIVTAWGIAIRRYCRDLSRNAGQASSPSKSPA